MFWFKLSKQLQLPTTEISVSPSNLDDKYLMLRFEKCGVYVNYHELDSVLKTIK